MCRVIGHWSKYMPTKFGHLVLLLIELQSRLLFESVIQTAPLAVDEEIKCVM